MEKQVFFFFYSIKKFRIINFAAKFESDQFKSKKMSGKNKLRKFTEMKTFHNVLEPELSEITNGKDSGVFLDHAMKGKWKEAFFGNDKPIVLELGCGKGEYSVGLGRKYPEKNFIGVDIKGARIWRGARTALDEQLDNIGFLRSRIDFITSFFASGEVDEIWITFPDPQPQRNRERKRLTSPLFINRYKQFLKPGGLVHLKTDSDSLYDYTMEQIEEHQYNLELTTRDLYGDAIESFDQDTQEILNIKTHYEGIFSAKGFSIKYCKFRIN